VTYAADVLLEEVAYVALNFHWSFGEILDLEHPTRQQLVSVIGDLVTRADEG
jgi:hypothetical protein